MTAQAIEDIPASWKHINDIPQIEQMIAHVKSDPIFRDEFFFRETNNPENAADGTYQPPAPFQALMWETLDQNDVIWIQGARGSSKSSGVARWLDGYCLVEPGTKAGIFAPAFRQSKQFHDYCVYYMQSNFGVDSHIYKLESELAADPVRGQEVLMKYKNTSLVEALPSGDGQKLRGKRFNVIVIEEAYQLQAEFNKQHILPMGNVKVGNRRTKTIYITTSWYTDVYAYTILQDIARHIQNGVPGYAIIDIRLQDVLSSGFPFDRKHILHQLEADSDHTTGKLSDDLKMTFFNVWIKSGASFYTNGMVSECQSPTVQVYDKRIPGDETPMVSGVDPATSGEDKCAMGIISCPGNDERYLRAIHQWKHLRPEEIAGNIHKMVDLYDTKIIVMDKTGGLGKIIADLCMKDLQLIDGQWQKRVPICMWDHPDARMARAHLVLTLPSDERMKIGVIGPRYDSSINSGGEADLKNVLHQNMRRVMQNGKFFAPKMLKDEDYYKSNLGEIMDNIIEGLGQFPKIDRKRGPNGKDILTDTRGNFTFTRPPKDDGAYAIIYANYAANIYYRMLEGKGNRGDVPGIWGENVEESKLREQHHQIILPRL